MVDSILMILTSHGQLGNAGRPTGSWLEELAAPYYRFVDAGIRVELASVAGGPAPIDPMSAEEAWLTSAGRRFQADADAQHEVANTKALDDIGTADYRAALLVGGSGTAWDFPNNKDIKRLIEGLNARGAIVAGVCHGVLGLTDAIGLDGLHLLKGRRVTGISTREDELAGVAAFVPVLPEERLRKAGAIYVAAAPFEANVITDGNIVTGQNPASALPLAEAIVSRLLAKKGTE